MPEISARDLRRLQALDERLRKAQDDRRRATAEARATRAQAEKAAREAVRLEEQVTALLEENKTLAAELETLRGDIDRSGGDARDARERAERAEAEAAEARAARDEAQTELKRLRVQAARFGERLQRAEAQLADKQLDPVVPPSRVAELVDGLLQDLSGGLSGIEVSRGELRLKVGVAMVDQQPGFVVPSAASGDVVLGSMQELNLQFNRRSAELRTEPE